MKIFNNDTIKEQIETTVYKTVKRCN
jgi:hypothetical protein